MNNIFTDTSYSSQPYSPNATTAFADTFFNFLNPGGQAQLDWIRDEQKNTNAYLRELYSDSTKYQRAVEDMKKAGLNPSVLFSNGASGTNMVSGNGGSAGGSTASPGGSMVKDLLKMGIDIGLAFVTRGGKTNTKVKHIGFK